MSPTGARCRFHGYGELPIQVGTDTRRQPPPATDLSDARFSRRVHHLQVEIIHHSIIHQKLQFIHFGQHNMCNEKTNMCIMRLVYLIYSTIIGKFSEMSNLPEHLKIVK